MTRRSRIALTAPVAAGALVFAFAVAHAADHSGVVQLFADQAKVIRIDRPADTVIIGNPAIADAAIRDNQTLIVTGRSFGTTNLIVLDAQGQPIADQLVTVQASDANVVTVYRRADRSTFSCTPTCEPTLTVGDNDTTFNARKTQVQGRNEIAQGTAASGK